jgi:hypothetical protein
MERVVERSNAKRALWRVKQNHGSPGVDGMTVEGLPVYLMRHWEEIRERLLAGTYQPRLVKRQTIPKRGGGRGSWGFRLWLTGSSSSASCRCSSRDSIRPFPSTATASGLGVVRTTRCVRRKGTSRKDAASWWTSTGGVTKERHEGTPQGGPLSPLLANVLLDEVDRELEKRGHAFVRYADDCNVYVRSLRAGERVFELLRRLYGRLRLRVNEAKSAVVRFQDSQLLGFRFWVGPGRTVRGRVAPESLQAMKQQVRRITGRNGGRSLESVVERLRGYLVGWKEYFRLAETPGVFEDLDKWIRRRLRMVQLKQWKRGSTACRELRARGVPPTRRRQGLHPRAPLVADLQARRPQPGSAHQLLRPSGSPQAGSVTSTFRTAGCGPHAGGVGGEQRARAGFQLEELFLAAPVMAQELRGPDFSIALTPLIG